MRKEPVSYLNGESKPLVPETIHFSKGDIDEGVVWSNFRNGSEEALIYIYRKYAVVIYNYGCQLTRDHEYVWDCVQDLFCELIKSRKQLGKVLSIKGYLIKSLKRKIFKGLKKINRTVILDADDHVFEISIPPGIASIAQTGGADQNRALEDCINQLPPHLREILLLYFYEGLSYQEIADIFEVKVKSIRTMTYRALEKLSGQLNADKTQLIIILTSLGLKIS